MAKIKQHPTAPTLHNVALEVSRECVREGLSSIYIVTAEHSSRVAEGDVVVVWNGLKLCESNVVVEFYKMGMINVENEYQNNKLLS